MFVPINPYLHCPWFISTEAVKLYRNKLTAYEQSEILDFSEVWFLGLEAKKIEAVQGAAQNSGYDDDNGSYIKVRLVLTLKTTTRGS